MPLSRYQIRNEYSLADPELYRAADKDDPEALLEGVAMAGLVGVLRQLGDLAEFAAEIFHNLHEEVMITAARGHSLLVRVQQLESDFPSIEREFLSQTGHSAFFSNSGVDWHPNMQAEQNLITKGDLPRFVMDSYEECRGPPRLFLLDKFDVAGAGACLKRYTDPSFYKMEASSFEMAGAETLKDKRIRKTKKKGPRFKNGETPEVLHSSHAKLHQLFLEERIHNGPSEPARRVKLKRRPNKFPFESESGKTYMEKLLKTQSEDKLVHEVPVESAPLMLPENSGGSAIEILEISTVGSTLGSVRQNRSPRVVPRVDEIVSSQLKGDLSENITERQTLELPASSLSLEAGSMSFGLQEEVDEKHVAVDGEIKTNSIEDGYHSDDVASETDNFVDALTTMESEVDADTESRTKSDTSLLNVEKQEMYSDAHADQPQSQSPDSQSSGHSTASDEGINSIRKEITSSSCSDTTSISADNVSIGGVGSPQAFGFTEIPFRPRASPHQVSVTEKVPVTRHPENEVSDGTSIEISEIPIHRSASERNLSMDQEEFPMEVSSIEAGSNKVFLDCENLNSPRKSEEHQTDMENPLLSDVPSPATKDSSSSPSFTRNSEDEDDEDYNACSSPVIEVSETAIGTSANSISSVSEAEHAEDGGTAGSEDKFSSSYSVFSHVEEQHAHPSPAELDVSDSDVKSREVAYSDDILAAEGTADSPHVSSIPEEQLKEIGDGLLVHESDSTEAGLSYFNKDETELGEREMESENSDNVSAPCDVARNVDHNLSNSVDELAFEERETVSIGSETKLLAAAVALPDKTDDDEDDDLGHDGELKEREAESETEVLTAVVPTYVDMGKNEENGLSTFEESDRNGLVINELHVIQKSNELSEKEEDQHSFLSAESDSVPCDIVSFDHANTQPLDDEHNSTLTTLVEENENDIGEPSANVKSFQNQSDSILEEPDQNGQQPAISPDLDSQMVEVAASDHSKVQCLSQSDSILEEPDQNGKQPVISPDLDSQMVDVAASDHSKVQWLSDVPESSMAEKSFDVATAVSSSSKCIEQDLQHESPNHCDQVDKFEVTSSISSLLTRLEEKVEQPIDQQSTQSPTASAPSSQSEGVDSHIASQPLDQEEELQGEQRDMGPITVAVPAHGSTHLECPVPVPGGPSALVLPQSSRQEVGPPDHVQYPFTPVLSGFGVLPQLAPINLEEMPPLPPLPPMQWRMGKLQTASSAPKTYGGQHSVDCFPPSIPSKAEEEPQIVSYPSLDGNRNPLNALMVLPHAEDRESHRDQEDLEGEKVSSSQILSTDACSDTEEHDKSSTLSEVKALDYTRSMVSQPALENEQHQNVAMTSVREIFWPSSTSSFPPVDEERPNGIRPMKIQRPRTPLIDAVAAHDKSKLRKVSELAKPQMAKEEERDTLLEQIRAKSFNLRPAVQTRPNIQQVPKTNLRVAAILEKANAIRQAFAGSDDEDEDSWSDS